MVFDEPVWHEKSGAQRRAARARRSGWLEEAMRTV
jgi:hypothetical protein